MFEKRGFMKTALALYCVFFLSSVAAQTAPDSVRHSTIVEADGYVFLSEDKTLSEMRHEALTAAKRSALEKGETYIQSVTKVENFQMQYDLIQSQSEGYVRVLESKDYGITKDNRYHIWIQAEIVFMPKQSVAKSEIQKDGLLTIKVWTDKEAYQENDKIRVFLKCSQNGYVRVLHINADGQVLQLLPNPLRKDNFCEGGKVMQIPGPKDAFQLEVVPPFGKEQIVVFASSEPLGEIPLSKVGQGLYLSTDNLNSVAMKTRGVRIAPVEGQPSVLGAAFVEMRHLIVIEK